jgi:two-component sensor histidine kinase
LSINFNEKNTNHYKLVISDNALGFNLEEVKKRKTLGLKLIEILVKQLEGNLDIDTSTKSPTTYTIEFPKTDK